MSVVLAESLLEPRTVVLQAVGAVSLAVSSFVHHNPWHLGAALFVLSTMALVRAMRALKRSACDPHWRPWLTFADRLSVPLILIGLYVPFTMVALRGEHPRWMLFSFAGSLALLGLVLDSLIPHRRDLIRAITRVTLAWLTVVALRPVAGLLHEVTLTWVLAITFGLLVSSVMSALRHVPKSWRSWELPDL